MRGPGCRLVWRRDGRVWGPAAWRAAGRGPGKGVATTFTTILVPLDGSALARRAVPYAVFLARAGRGRLIFLHAVAERAAPRGAHPDAEGVPDHEALLAECRAAGVEAAAHTVAGAAGAAIVRAAGELEADLVMMSTHGRGGLGRLLMGSVAEEVVRHAPAPVLLVAARCERRWEADRAFRMLVPLDGSPLAEAALPPSETLARLLGAELWLLRVAPGHLELSPLGFGYTEPATRQELVDARAYLEGVAAALRPAARTVTVRVVAGQPAAEIVRLAADEAIDLVVMATHGHDTVGRLILDRVAAATTGGRIHFNLGSVAAAVLQRGSAPVLLTRCTGKRCTARAARSNSGPTTAGQGA